MAETIQNVNQSTVQNTLCFGDNLDVMRKHIPDESVDLIYLDPPFNSNRNYNVLFRENDGAASYSDAQIMAFGDTWKWDRVAHATYEELLNDAPAAVGKMIGAMYTFLGNSQMMAYLVMMAARLVELHRVLKSTGSLYLHCDPTASHYLKIILDTIFGAENFRNEIVWKRTNAKGLAFTRYASNHDTLLFYSKTDNWTWNAQYTTHDPEYVESFYKNVEPNTGRRYGLDNLANPNKNRPNLTYEFLGVTRVWRWTKERMQKAYEDGLIVQNKVDSVPRLKRYLDEQEGTPVGDVWTDINPLQAKEAEAMGYPTQKPVALLERIIQASSNPGDVVLDPFCGCGTTIAAAQKLGRRWIGIDITHLAITLIRGRLRDMYGDKGATGERLYRVIGLPEDLSGATQLARDSENDGRYQFQFWALSLIGAKPVGIDPKTGKAGKKGADRGIDGEINFNDMGKPARVLVQIKSGKVKSGDIRDLKGVLDREGAQIGVFVTLEASTSEMNREAVSAGSFESRFGQKYPRVQILTIRDLLEGKQIHMPPTSTTFTRAEKVSGNKVLEGMDPLM